MVIDSSFILTEDQKDLFQELINIAYGRAAGLLHDFTDVEVNLHIPQINFLNYEKFLAQVQAEMSDSMIVSQQSFHGKISGETLIIFSEQEATKLCQLLNQSDSVQMREVLSAVYDVGNMITTTSTQTLSELTAQPIEFNKPITNSQTYHSLSQILQEIDYSQIISILTYLDIPTANIRAQIYYLFYRESMELLAQSLHYPD